MNDAEAAEFLEAYKQGYHREQDLVRFIRKRLMEPREKLWLARNDIEVADILNGRVEGEQQQNACDQLMRRWNERAGFRMFHV